MSPEDASPVVPGRRPALSARRRSVVGLGDQAFSSLTNFALNVLVARSVDTAALGAYALAFAAYLLALNVARAVAVQPLVVRQSLTDHADWADAAGGASGVAVVTGLLAGLGCLITGAAIGGSSGLTFVVLGLSLPGLLLQDAWRYAFVVSGHGHGALALDVLWAALLFPALGALIVSGTTTVPAIVAIWGITGSLAGVAAVAATGIRPKASHARRWWRAHRDLVPALLAGTLVELGGQTVTTFAIGLIVGLATVGTLRAGQLVLSPLFVLFQGVTLVAPPEAARLLRASPAAMQRLLLSLGVGLAAVVLVGGAIAMSVPDELGRLVIRGNWDAAHSVLLPMTIALAAQVSMAAAGMGLIVMAAPWRALRAGIVAAGAILVLEVGGAAAGGAFTAASGLACAYGIGLVAYVVEFRAEMRSRRGTPG